MGYVGKITAGGSTHLVGSTLYGTCSTAAGTAEKDVVCPDFTNAIEGLTIHIKFTNANSASTCKLNINETGAVNAYRYGTTSPGTSASWSWYAGAVVSFTYDGEHWIMNDMIGNDNSNNYDRLILNRAIKGAAAVTKEHVIVGTSAGYKMVASGVEFDITYPILWASAAISSGGTVTTTYIDYTAVNLATSKSGWTGTTYSSVFLVLSAFDGRTATIDSSIFTTTQPTSANGKFYIPLGMMYSTTSCFFHPKDEVYAYINGAFQPYSLSAWPYTVVKSGI